MSPGAAQANSTHDIPAASVVERTRHSFFAPSLTDLAFFFILFWLFAAAPEGWDRLVFDGDVALHTRTGDFILEHGYVPRVDVFSFTRPGDRWYALQWLTGVWFALLNRWAGLKAIVLFSGAIISLYQVILLRDMVCRGVNGLFAILLVLVAGNAAMIHYHARPHVFTLLFLACAGYAIARDRERRSNRFWLLVPMTALWANLHSGFPVVIVLLGLLTAGCALSAALGDTSWDAAKRYGGATALCGLASLLNPNGYALHEHILRFLGNDWIKNNISEYQSPSFRSEAMLCFLILLFAGLFFANSFVRRRQWAEALWIGFFAYWSLMSARHIPVFLVVSLPLTGAALTEAWNAFTADLPRASTWRILGDMADRTTTRLKPISIWSMAAVAGLFFFGNPQNWPKDLSAEYFPRSMVRAHAEELASARVFTTDQWGDYLLWVNYPRQKVFMDGRSDFFGETIGRDYVKIGSAAPGWRDALRKYDVDAALLPAGTALVELLEKEPAWRAVDRDKMSVLLSRVGGAK